MKPPEIKTVARIQAQFSNRHSSVLTRVMMNPRHRLPTVPMLVVGKEISYEDVRISLEKMPDRLMEHPLTALTITNMFYSEAPA